MQTLYLLIFTAIGGCLSLFAAAGWSSYKDKKLPATPMLFRWFITGILVSGLGAYAWLFGAGGDPSSLIEKMGEALEVKEVVESLTAAVSSDAVAQVATAASELTVGMPSF